MAGETGGSERMAPAEPLRARLFMLATSVRTFEVEQAVAAASIQEPESIISAVREAEEWGKREWGKREVRRPVVRSVRREQWWTALEGAREPARSGDRTVGVGARRAGGARFGRLPPKTLTVATSRM